MVEDFNFKQKRGTELPLLGIDCLISIDDIEANLIKNAYSNAFINNRILKVDRVHLT